MCEHERRPDMKRGMYYACLAVLLAGIGVLMYAHLAAAQVPPQVEAWCWERYPCQQATHVVQGAAIQLGTDWIGQDVVGPDEALFLTFGWALFTEAQDAISHGEEFGTMGPGEPTGDFDPAIDLAFKTLGALSGRFLSVKFDGLLPALPW